MNVRRVDHVHFVDRMECAAQEKLEMVDVTMCLGEMTSIAVLFQV